MNTIGNLVKAAREAKNLDREQLAKKINVTPGYLAHIERDDLVRVSNELASNLKRVLKVNINPLMDQHNIHVSRQVRAYRKRA